ncbi:hypothetical protein TPL01_20340 [Sulfuriferula plumbiphila]|uniref:Uncharacterized protein n=1 Tax=Sulfuriferula plumbiphila TaxID=171865 RepID=A0A512L8T2_9PROT|nr:hypothetical protein [Sulfuriferula plumbiphila]BBP04274.1 hypothetical protein SFPGR_16960 [Sulfuriferula plumbiphila]GEP30896.1 hypothetical protein TPL01_20340 [Sulfuriferula plumbiphila]
MEETDLDLLRDSLARLMEDGLETEWRERAYTSEAVNAVVARLQSLRPDDVEGKLRVAGFRLQPYDCTEEEISQACETCMYYVKHRQFCDLPELQLPVRPEWSCRLWRI